MHDLESDEEKERQDFVAELIQSGMLEGTALGVAKFYVDSGRSALSEKQRHVLDEYVFAPYVTKECTRCAEPIPWSEQLAAYHNGGYCGYCQHMWERLKDE